MVQYIVRLRLDFERGVGRAKGQACARDTLEIVNVVADVADLLPREPSSGKFSINREAFIVYGRDDVELQFGAPCLEDFIFLFRHHKHWEIKTRTKNVQR